MENGVPKGNDGIIQIVEKHTVSLELNDRVTNLQTMTSPTNPKGTPKRQKTKIIEVELTEIGVPTKVTAGAMRSGEATHIDTRYGATVRSHGSTVPPTTKTRAVLGCSQSIKLQRTNQKGKHAQRIKKQTTMLGIQAAGQRRLMLLQFPTENKFTLQRPFTAKKHRKENINCRHKQYHQSTKLQSVQPWHPSPPYART